MRPANQGCNAVMDGRPGRTIMSVQAAVREVAERAHMLLRWPRRPTDRRVSDGLDLPAIPVELLSTRRLRPIEKPFRRRHLAIRPSRKRHAFRDPSNRRVWNLLSDPERKCLPQGSIRWQTNGSSNRRHALLRAARHSTPGCLPSSSITQGTHSLIPTKMDSCDELPDIPLAVDHGCTTAMHRIRWRPFGGASRAYANRRYVARLHRDRWHTDPGRSARWIAGS